MRALTNDAPFPFPPPLPAHSSTIINHTSTTPITHSDCTGPLPTVVYLYPLLHLTPPPNTHTQPYGWQPLASISGGDAACKEERCVAGAATGCATVGPWSYILMIITMALLVVYFSMFIFTLYMLAGLKKHGNLSCNAQVSTIITISIAIFFCCLWLPNYTFDIAQNGNKAWSNNMMNPIAVPGSALFVCIAALNLSLM